ncbi:MAG: ABC-type transport system involved in multi-copper enzyme maturation permease subunit [Planctomycetota bacterium]|jgi:ABC-type transport system involved in multi-copper enzyme maturation permease subunit
MTGTWRVVRAEGIRLVTSRAAWVAVLLVLLLSAARTGLEISIIDNQNNGLDRGRGWAPLVDGLRAGLTLSTLLLIASAAKGLAGDLESGLVRLSVTRSTSRAALVFGRFLIGIPALLTLVLAATGAAFVTAWLQLDFGPLAEDGYEMFSAMEVGTELLQAWLGVLPAMLSAWAFGLLVGACSRSAAGAVATSLGLLITFDLLKDSLGPLARFSFAYHAPTLVDSQESGLLGVSQLARGFSDGGVSESMLRMAYTLPWPQTLLLVLLAALVVRKRAL